MLPFFDFSNYVFVCGAESGGLGISKNGYPAVLPFDGPPGMC